MNDSLSPQSDNAPFGTRPRRGSGPLILLGVLYAAWFGVLLWMAATQV